MYETQANQIRTGWWKWVQMGRIRDFSPENGGYSKGTCLDYGGVVACLSGPETIARIFH